jgi:hypothetical protein
MVPDTSIVIQTNRRMYFDDEVRLGVLLHHGLCTQWRHKSKISENFGRCGRQNMLPSCLWDWEWIFGCEVKAISSLAVYSLCATLCVMSWCITVLAEIGDSMVILGNPGVYIDWPKLVRLYVLLLYVMGFITKYNCLVMNPIKNGVGRYCGATLAA